ncbi:bacillithiol biosynthesis deacetylase BshB2 [Lysinibacillus composti]|uniref:Bacillithiol biosynthesis deacetylase BshB2 n=1 Tax=Lysinibacillus composti TaxID=720633 RepID=A0A3N9UHS0_9BACI|nr:bacillithiol biosynthesis deacetylase BshB2 [Lysinibacillus composti]MBM7608971.1 bacillithiol biosynthesis deacetylase BshB2 [Lysinibacillus composti]RQW75604.1 bacillithiol biosynthesis deacetylase BshB2 [Lysinibacillus composti]
MSLQPERHVLVVFPHPDDEAFSSAGTIRLYRNMGVPVTYACLTLGEMGRNLGNPPFATRESLPEIRRKELINACAAMGIEDLRMMGLRDKTVEFENDEKMVKLVTDLIDELNPSLIITFYPGYAVHPDHEATARAVVEAVRRIPKNDRPRITAVAFANNTIANIGEPTFKNDVSSVKQDKIKALQAHASQTAWMMEETTKRVEEGRPMSESWLNFEPYYNYEFKD